MNFRTDLALEAVEIHQNINGLKITEEKKGKSTVTKMMIKTREAAEKLGKNKGKYITISIPPLTEYFKVTDERIKIISDEIKNLIPKDGLVLVAGLGNINITPDALGPKVLDNVLATRHITQELAKSIGLQNLRPVSSIIPGVLGKTGIEVCETLISLIDSINPCCAIIIDAMVSRRLNRLGCTVQLSDAGISPGSGVGNERPLLDKNTLGIPVVSIGIPTVVDALTLARDIVNDFSKNPKENINQNSESFAKNMIVTPKEIDLMIKHASLLVAMSINCALQPSFSPEELYNLVS